MSNVTTTPGTSETALVLPVYDESLILSITAAAAIPTDLLFVIDVATFIPTETPGIATFDDDQHSSTDSELEATHTTKSLGDLSVGDIFEVDDGYTTFEFAVVARGKDETECEQLSYQGVDLPGGYELELVKFQDLPNCMPVRVEIELVEP